MGELCEPVGANKMYGRAMRARMGGLYPPFLYTKTINCDIIYL